MTCTKTQLLVLLMKIRRELTCGVDKDIIDVYIERLEQLTTEEIEKQLFT